MNDPNEFRLKYRPQAYLEGRRDAFEVAAEIVNEARGESRDLRCIRDDFRLYANATIAEMNRRTDKLLSDNTFNTMLNLIAPYLEGCVDAHALAEKIITALLLRVELADRTAAAAEPRGTTAPTERKP